MASSKDFRSMLIPVSMDPEKYLAYITTCGMLASAMVIMSPMSFMIKVSMGGVESNEILSMMPTIVMMFVQSALWACFGFVTVHLSICHINGFGALMGIIYLHILTQGAHAVHRRRANIVFYGVVVSVFAIALGTLVFVHDINMQISVLSNLATGFNVGLNVTPLGQLYEVFQTRKIGNFPFGLTLCGLFSSILWGEYSLVIGSVPYLIPNVVGVISNGLTIIGYTYIFIVGASKDPAYMPLMQKSSFLPTYDCHRTKERFTRIAQRAIPSISKTDEKSKKTLKGSCPDGSGSDEDVTTAASTSETELPADGKNPNCRSELPWCQKEDPDCEKTLYDKICNAVLDGRRMENSVDEKASGDTGGS